MKILKRIVILIWPFCITYATNHTLYDLEEYCQDFVLETKQIMLPGYPHAFNPSLIRWHGKLLMSFRVIPDKTKPFTSWLGLVWLDEQFNPIGKPQRLYTHHYMRTHISRAEDGRLIVVNQRLYLVYSDNTEPIISKKGFRIYLAQVHWNGKKFFVTDNECLSSFTTACTDKREKNWIPFEYGDQLLLAYSIVPHLIFMPLCGTGHCETFVYSDKVVAWRWGELRGGTPALQEDDHYLAFFHSSVPIKTIHSQGQKIVHYFIGAYTFSAQLPFTITRISTQPIVGKQFYHGKEYEAYWKPVHVVFPCGFIKNDDYIWLSYGRQDHEMWVAKLDKKKLYQSLSKV